MIRAAALPVRSATALAGVAGVLALAGCAGGTAPTDAGDAAGGDAPAPVDGAAYVDGTYTAEGTYNTPETVETISVTITLADGTVTAVEVTGDPQRPESRQYQGEFIGGIEGEVVGKHIDEISVSRVAGSSLTSGGFNSAIELIKQQATG